MPVGSIDLIRSDTPYLLTELYTFNNFFFFFGMYALTPAVGRTYALVC